MLRLGIFLIILAVIYTSLPDLHKSPTSYSLIISLTTGYGLNGYPKFLLYEERKQAKKKKKIEVIIIKNPRLCV